MLGGGGGGGAPIIKEGPTLFKHGDRGGSWSVLR